ncbi:sugar phosphate isomerase/epimerase family protein [Methanooceanicella nereidis]|uniref:sugar phosphate isomerase/epimerase family protein n=1 Tax=Methanooceanicella nereidis TaxID=2052831 RepID=UPI001E2CD719|nr:TIM barrel protein [Methanocella sp. CWC-04]
MKSICCYLFKDKILYLKEKYSNNIIAIENNAPCNISCLKPIMNIKNIRDFAYEHDVFINFDVSNCAATGKDILLSYDMIAPRVKSVHLSDFGGTKGMSHLIPGKGLLPLGMLLSRMKQFNFNGNISFEIDPKELENYEEGEIITLYKELIGYVKSYF